MGKNADLSNVLNVGPPLVLLLPQRNKDSGSWDQLTSMYEQGKVLVLLPLCIQICPPLYTDCFLNYHIHVCILLS